MSDSFFVDYFQVGLLSQGWPGDAARQVDASGSVPRWRLYVQDRCLVIIVIIITSTGFIFVGVFTAQRRLAVCNADYALWLKTG